MKVQMVSMHAMVSHVLKVYKVKPRFTCMLVADIFGDSAVAAWCKLLEESFPGCVYGHYGWKNSSAYGMFAIYSNFYNKSPCESFNFRIEFMKKLLNQPDRMICWLE